VDMRIRSRSPHANTLIHLSRGWSGQILSGMVASILILSCTSYSGAGSDQRGKTHELYTTDRERCRQAGLRVSEDVLD
jgi:hypothetical protein